MEDEQVRQFYIPLFLYIVGLNIVLVAAVALLHELGHAVLGHIHGCANVNIVFDTSMHDTYAHMACPTNPGAVQLVLSSFLFVLPVSGLFSALRQFKERYIGHILLGIGVIAAAADVHGLTGNTALLLLTAAAGGVIAVYGEERLINGIIATEVVSPQRHRELAAEGQDS